MKKLMLSLAVLTTLMTTSAQAFVPQMYFFLNREVAVVRVANTTPRNIVCFGTAYGRTWRGMVMMSHVGNLIVRPRQFMDVYVHSNYYDPMIDVWAQIDCRYM